VSELDPDVTETLVRMARVDRDAALDAGVALEWLVGSNGLDRLHQAGLQQFLWYELPFKWLGPLSGRRELVDALARFLDLAGLARYAALCRCAVTTELLELWADDAVAGFDSFQSAHTGSGVVPPDLDNLKWGELMGETELDAFWSTAQILELAVGAGVLAPGSKGWKRRQVELAEQHLKRSRPEHFGESILEAVQAERLTAWVEQSRSGARRALIEPITNLLLHEVPAPRDAARTLRPLAWLVLALERPVAVGATGGVPPRLVREAVSRWGWGTVRARHTEFDVPAVRALRELAASAGLIRKRAGRWSATTRGLDLARRPRQLWAPVVEAVGSQPGFAGAVSELLDAQLLGDERPRRHDLVGTIRVAVTEQGWHSGVSGRPVRAEVLGAELDRQLALRMALGGLARRGGAPLEPPRITTSGAALCRAVLRARALLPREEPLRRR